MATTASGFWYPDEGTSFNINTIMSTAMSSVETKAGPHVTSSEAQFSITDTSNFNYYQGGAITASREGRVVEFSGQLECRTAGFVSSTARRVVGVLPVGYRPKSHYHGIMQGSGFSKWLLYINTAGSVQATRADGTQNAGYWMPFSATYLVA